MWANAQRDGYRCLLDLCVKGTMSPQSGCVCVCVCQLLRQLSAECHVFHHRPLTVVEPQSVDDHYVTVNDPTTVHALLAGRTVDHPEPPPPPRSPGVRPVSAAGHGGGAGGVVLRLRRRADDSTSPPPVDQRHQSVLLYDKQQMQRRARHRPSYRRLKSTPSDRSYHPSTPSVPSLLFLLFCEQQKNCLQCFDTVTWARPVKKLTDEVLASLSVWSKVQIISIWSS